MYKGKTIGETGRGGSSLNFLYNPPFVNLFWFTPCYRLVLMPFFIILASNGIKSVAEMIAPHKKSNFDLDNIQNV